MSHPGHDTSREQSRAREGFALPLAIMVLALLSIGLVAGFAMSTSEQAATGDDPAATVPSPNTGTNRDTRRRRDARRGTDRRGTGRRGKRRRTTT